MQVYTGMSDEDARNYAKLKEALLYKYDYTEEGFRQKFRTSRAEKNESPDQFIARLQGYFDRWISFSGTEESYKGIRDFIIRE